MFNHWEQARAMQAAPLRHIQDAGYPIEDKGLFARRNTAEQHLIDLAARLEYTQAALRLLDKGHPTVPDPRNQHATSLDERYWLAQAQQARAALHDAVTTVLNEQRS